MSDAVDVKLYGLIEIAERQQAVAQTLLEDFAAERAALTRERSQWANNIDAFSQDVRSTISNAVGESMAGMADVGKEAFGRLDGALVDSLARISVQADEAEMVLRSLVQWASWRLLSWSLGAIAGIAMLWWLASCAILWWDTSAIGAAQAEKVQLQAELAGLRANRDDWVKAGMLAKLERCGPKKRLCIRTDERAGSFGDESDYRVIRGY